MAEQFLYLTTTGRTTGQPRQIEIWFAEHAGRFYLVSERRQESGWVKNIERDPAVFFSVGTRGEKQAAVPRQPAQARIIHAHAEPELAKTVAALMNKKYGWSDGLIVELAGETAPKVPAR